MRELQVSLVLRTRARYLLTWLIVITIGSGLVVMPGQPRTALAAEILVVSVSAVAYTVRSVLQTVRRELPTVSADLASRWLGMGVTWLLSIGAGISLLAGADGGLYLLAFAMLLGIALQVAAAWTLLVEAGRHVPGKGIITPQRDVAGQPRAGQPAAGEGEPRAVPGR